MSLLSYRRFLGTKIVWTAHNSFSHEHYHPKLENLFWKGLLRRLDGIIAHSNTARAELIKKTSGKLPIAVIPLSHFRGLYPSAKTTRSKSASGLHLGFIGRIRPYKGVPDLIQAFRPCTNPGISLTIRGKPENMETAKAIADLCASDSRISLQYGFLSPEDLTNEIATLDAVVLPFKWVTNSGSALLALSLGTRVVVPRTAYFLELQNEFSPEWVFCFQGEMTPATIDEICIWAKNPTSNPEPIIPESRSIPWAAKATLEFFRTLTCTL